MNVFHLTDSLLQKCIIFPLEESRKKISYRVGDYVHVCTLFTHPESSPKSFRSSK